METLAIHGGPKVKTTPFGTGRRFDYAEVQQLIEALDQNTLFYWYGKKVKEFTRKFADMYGRKHCVAASSGTGGIHVALGTLGVTEGDEVIVSPVTDMGSIIGILYQNAIPVFADIDPYTYNIDAASIESKITDKTKAIQVVHLAGNAADMDAIMDVAQRHNLRVVEDCAQSYECFYKGRRAGAIGDIGCFSTNDYKHISTGDGGMIIMDDYALYEKAHRFADKNYNRLSADIRVGIEYIAPNYRMSELQGAVAIAQLDKLEWICARRHEYGERITRGIGGICGIIPRKVIEGGKSSFYDYLFRFDEKEAGVSKADFCKAVCAEGVYLGGYGRTCVYEYGLFKNRVGYEGTHAPFDSKYYGREIVYETGLCPEAEKVVETICACSVKEFYTDQDIDDIVNAIQKVARYYNM